ncbi:hypothetical protein FQR65_LT05637 [Abscondita terminalis]|nr:hypothetical protein FQR65_LT05637 [Abscondita terminalis]
MRAVVTFAVAFVGFLVFVCDWGNADSGNSVGYVDLHHLTKCPKSCACSGTTVDCSHRGLTQVPRNFPPDAEKMTSMGIIFRGDS